MCLIISTLPKSKSISKAKKQKTGCRNCTTLELFNFLALRNPKDNLLICLLHFCDTFCDKLLRSVTSCNTMTTKPPHLATIDYKRLHRLHVFLENKRNFKMSIKLKPQTEYCRQIFNTIDSTGFEQDSSLQVSFSRFYEFMAGLAEIDLLPERDFEVE